MSIEKADQNGHTPVEPNPSFFSCIFITFFRRIFDPGNLNLSDSIQTGDQPRITAKLKKNNQNPRRNKLFSPLPRCPGKGGGSGQVVIWTRSPAKYEQISKILAPLEPRGSI